MAARLAPEMSLPPPPRGATRPDPLRCPALLLLLLASLRRAAR